LVVPKLRDLGVHRLDLILLTHPDMDHMGGAGAVLREYPRAQVAVSARFRHHPELLGKLREWGVRDPLWLSGPGKLTYGHTVMLFATPPGEEDNDQSLALKIEHRGATAVLTGDAGIDTEHWLARHGEWSGQVLKAGHHGSRGSTSHVWLREVRPSDVVISCGRDNLYGHPHRDTLRRLNGVQVYRTDREGDITFIPVDGKLKRAR
jgi:competence protein ComEC